MAVQQKYDPVRVPSHSLTPGEIDELYDLIDKGELPKDYVDRHFEAVQKNVFGFDAKQHKGKYIEQGLGSPGNQTANSIAAYIKTQTERQGGPEEGYEENLKRMRAELAASDARRRGDAEKKGKGARRYAA